MKVDVEEFEIEVLRGCARTLAEHRIGLIQLEWNAMSEQAPGTGLRPGRVRLPAGQNTASGFTSERLKQASAGYPVKG